MSLVMPLQAARLAHVERAYRELKTMPKFTHAVILTLGADALTVHVHTELPARALREILVETLKHLDNQRGSAPTAQSKLIIAS